MPEALKSALQSYKITIQAEAKKTEYNLADAGISVDTDASVSATTKMNNSLMRRLGWWQTKQPIIVFKTDQTKFKDFLQKSATIVKKPMVNATVVIAPKGEISIQPGQVGEELSNSQTEKIITTNLTALKNIVVTLESHSVSPAITDQAAQKAKTKVDEIIAKPIVFDADGDKIEATANDKASWLVARPNLVTKNIDISVDPDVVSDFVNNIASNSTHPPRDQVEIVQPGGGKTVLVQGISGRAVSNKDEVTKTLNQQILASGPINLELKFDFSPYKTVSANAGPKMIEVNLSSKRMYTYENSTLLRTFLVSAGAAETPTVTGQYAIYSKIRRQDMRGFNADGSTYFTPNVEYVNYFYRDYAIHGNYWRPVSYFGNINASHGCVGIVNTDAEWIYNWAPVGTPVVVHW